MATTVEEGWVMGRTATVKIGRPGAQLSFIVTFDLRQVGPSLSVPQFLSISNEGVEFVMVLPPG